MGRADEVEVRTRFDGGWISGFELHDVAPEGNAVRFRVRRQSDGIVLPGWFSAAEVRLPQQARDVVDDLERRFLTDPETPLPPPAGEG